MLSLLFGVSAALDPVPTRICICQIECPADCDTVEKIIASTMNVTAAILAVKTGYMKLSFINSESHIIDSSVFNDATTIFECKGTKASLTLTFQSEMSGDMTFEFDNVEPTFHDLNSRGAHKMTLKALILDDEFPLTLNPNTISLNVNKLNGTLTAIRSFPSVVVNEWMVTKGAENIESAFGANSLRIIGEGTTTAITFGGSAYAAVTGTGELTVSNSGVVASSLPNVTLDGFRKLIVKGDWGTVVPTAQNIIQFTSMQSDERNPTVFEIRSTTVPFAIYGVYGSMTVYNSVKIFGIVNFTKVIGITTEEDMFNRITFEFADRFYANTMNVTSDVIDFTLKTLEYKVQGNLGDFPIIFGMGLYGWSTFRITGDITSVTSYRFGDFETNILFKEPFYPDSAMDILLGRNWTILSCNFFPFFDDEAILKFDVSKRFLGFSTSFPKHSAQRTTVDIQDTGITIDVWTYTMPSQITRSLCYQQSLCYALSADNVHVPQPTDFMDLSKEYFVNGMTKLEIAVGSTDLTINLDAFSSYSTPFDVTIVVASSSEAFNINSGTTIDRLNSLTIASYSLVTMNTLKKTLNLQVSHLILRNVGLQPSRTITLPLSAKMTVDERSLPLVKRLTGTLFELVVDFDASSSTTLEFDDGVWIFNGIEFDQRSIGSLTVYRTGTFIMNPPTEIVSTKGFTVLTSSHSTVTLSGHWTQIQTIDPPICIDHGPWQLNVVIVEPFVHENFTLSGSGEVSYVNDYGGNGSLCACSGEYCNRCESEQVTFADLSSRIQSHDSLTVVVTVAGSTLDTHAVIDMISLDKKAVSFEALTNAEWISFTSGTPLTDTRFSTVSITKLTVVSTAAALKFGTLTLTSCQFDTTIVDLTVDDLNCTYDVFDKFKQVTIIDSLSVYGDLTSREAIVKFIQDENDDDLVARVPSGEIVFGDKNVKIGGTTFEIIPSEVIDCVIVPEVGSQLTISCVPGLTAGQMILSEIDEDGQCQITFTRSWPTFEGGQGITVSDGAYSSTFIFECAKVPLTIRNPTDLTLMAAVDSVDITGDIYIDDAGDVNLNIDKKDTVTFATFNFGRVYLDNSIMDVSGFKVMNSQIHVVIDEFIGLETQQSNIVFRTVVDLNGLATFTVNKPLVNCDFDGDINLISTISGKHTDAELSALVDHNWTVLRAQKVDIRQIRLVMVEWESVPADPTHGFSKKNPLFKIRCSDDLRSIVIYSPTKASELPFRMGWFYTSTYEPVEFSFDRTTQDQVNSNLQAYLPAEIKHIEIYVERNMEANLYFGFNALEGYTGMNVSFIGGHTTNYDVRMALKQNVISRLYLSDIDLFDSGPTAQLNLDLDFINLSSSTFDSTCVKRMQFDRLKCIESDVDTFKTLLRDMTSFRGELIIRQPTTLNFTETGWIAKNSWETITINAANYSKVSFSTWFVSGYDLQIQDAAVRRIQRTSMIMHPYLGTKSTVTYGKYWNNIENRDDLEIAAVDTLNMRILSSSFPFPHVDAGDAELEVILTDLDPVVLPDGFRFDGETYSFDFTKGVSYTITGETMYFKGKTSVSFVKDNAYVNADHVFIETDSDVEIEQMNVAGKQLTLYQNSQLTSYLMTDDRTEITFNWDQDNVPRLHLTTVPEVPPMVIHVAYNKTTADPTKTEEMRGKPFRLISATGTLNCSAWAEKMVFESSVELFGPTGKLRPYCYDNSLHMILSDTTPIVSPTDIPPTQAPSTTALPPPPVTSQSRVESPTEHASQVRPSVVSHKTHAPGTEGTPDPTEKSGSGNKKSIIIGATVGAVALVAIVTVVVLVVTCRRPRYGLNTTKLDDLGYDQVTESEDTL